MSAAGATSFLFAATVGEAEVVGSASALYTVTVRTNLADYAEQGSLSDEPDAEQDDIFKLETERIIIVKRSYSAFTEVRLCAGPRRGGPALSFLALLTPRAFGSLRWPLSCATR
jgi:hypothetical protein